MQNNFVAANEAANQANHFYGLNLNSAVAKVAAPYDNEGACAELAKDMSRGDNLSIRFTKDADNYASVWVESKNVAGYKVRLNQSILSWIMAYLEDGVAEWLLSKQMERHIRRISLSSSSMLARKSSGLRSLESETVS